jgi:hypothetical protein
MAVGNEITQSAKIAKKNLVVKATIDARNPDSCLLIENVHLGDLGDLGGSIHTSPLGRVLRLWGRGCEPGGRKL